jgi:hypothetical protein
MYLYLGQRRDGADSGKFSLDCQNTTALAAEKRQLSCEPLAKRTFRRRIEELDFVEPVTGAPVAAAAHRPAQRYRVKRRFGRELALAERLLG